MILEHHEMIAIARLLAHHIGSNGTTPLDSAALKLMEYAEFTGNEIHPLQLAETKIAGYPDRVGVRVASFSPGV